MEDETVFMQHEDVYLASWMPPGSTYPPYVSINYRNTMVEITIRSPQESDGSCGDTATVRLNRCQFNNLVREALKNMG